MSYNLTPIYNANTTLEIIDGFMQVSDNTGLFVFVLFMLYLTILAVYGKNDIVKVSISASFITATIGLVLFAMGWVGLHIIILPIILLIISVIALKFFD